MTEGQRVVAAIVGGLTVVVGFALARMANAWRRAERERDEGKPLLQQERLYSFTRMNTVWNVRFFTWFAILVGVALVMMAVFNIVPTATTPTHLR
jgi:hypothetical protein